MPPHTPDLNANRPDGFEVLLGATSNGVIMTDAGRRITVFNRVAEHLANWSGEEADGILVDEVVSLFRASDQKPVQLPTLEQLGVEGCMDFQSPLLLIGRKGSESLVHVKFRLLREASGQAIGMALILRDFTSTRASEKVIMESETRLRRVMEGSRLGYWDWDLATGRVLFSGRWASMLGYEPDEIRGDFETWERIVHPEDKPRVMASLKALLEGVANTYEEEHRLRTKSGGWRWVMTSGNIVARNTQGRPLQLAGTHTDIHEKKVAEEAVHRRDEETIRFQEALLKLRDHVGQDIADFYRIATVEASQALRVERVSIWFFEEDGEAIVCQSLFIQSEKRHSQGMRIKAADYPTYFSAVRDHLAVRADDAMSHPSTCEFAETYFGPLGITSMLDVPIRMGGQTVGLLCCEHTGPSRQWSGEEEKFSISMAASVLLALENVKRKETEAAMREMNENLERLVASRTRELRKSERRFHDLFEFAPDAILMSNPQGMVTLVNLALERLFVHERSELLGRPMEVLVEGLRAKALEARFKLVAGAKTVSLDFGRHQLLGTRRDGTRFPVEASLSSVGSDQDASLVVSLRDVSERENSQKLLLRTQRLESIGTLAGGLAHDLNNALSPILLSTEMLRQHYPGEGKLLELIEKSAHRGTEMVRQLLTFAKGVEGARHNLRSEDLFGEVAHIISSTFPKNISLETHCGEGLPGILGDSTQLHQVLLNLCLNARDAMPEGGRLRLAAFRETIGPGQASGMPDAKDGDYVVWVVQDSGTGIPEEIQERIFEPFFTTKDLDKGTGLGLSTVLGIVRSHGGFIRLHSAPGRGASFALHLPAVVASSPIPATANADSGRFVGGGELVLVVDDEPMVLDMVATLLGSMGFRIITASDGIEGLRMALEHRLELRVVISDLHMPRMDGMDLLQALHSRLPEAGIIVTSGRLDERQVAELRKAGAGVVLAKPFRQRELIEAFKTVLGKS